MVKLFKKRKGQNVAEYAILIAMVIGAVLAMQKFAQRGLQARFFDATQFLVENTQEFGNVAQYEPYYLDSQYETTRGANETKTATNETSFNMNAQSSVTRGNEGYQATTYQDNGLIGTGMEFGQ